MIEESTISQILSTSVRAYISSDLLVGWRYLFGLAKDMFLVQQRMQVLRANGGCDDQDTGGQLLRVG